jgi:hypothetical protein
MKTKNLILIIALLSIATVTFSQSKNVDYPFTVKITLKCALQDPYFVRAMHEQIPHNFLPSNTEDHVYSAVVIYRGTRYLVYGRYDEWKKFFEVALEDPTPEH